MQLQLQPGTSVCHHQVIDLALWVVAVISHGNLVAIQCGCKQFSSTPFLFSDEHLMLLEPKKSTFPLFQSATSFSFSRFLLSKSLGEGWDNGGHWSEIPTRGGPCVNVYVQCSIDIDKRSNPKEIEVAENCTQTGSVCRPTQSRQNYG